MDQTSNPHGSEHTHVSSYYEIRVMGQLDSSWSDWFNEGLKVTTQENGETLISGLLPDQAALQATLTKIFDLRLTLLSITRFPPQAG